ncbi:MAG: hypothetical protein LJE94_10490 [Deltaproteobacteria bacterium]|nr:hypothetical protein [Deltaproteobacteria bacterium]
MVITIPVKRRSRKRHRVRANRAHGWALKICVYSAALALFGWALNGQSMATGLADVVESGPHGTINWTLGVLSTSGVATPPEKSEAKSAEELQEAQKNAISLARRHMMALVLKTRVDSERSIESLVANNDLMMTKVETLVKGVKATGQTYLSDGTVEITMQMNMYGGFAQLVLPEEIRQIEPIKTVANGHKTAKGTLQPSDPKPEKEIFTGLVVDARGIQFSPAMAPVIVDEKAREVYGSAFASREFAVQQGMCGYTRDMQMAGQDPRVAGKPLVVKGLGTEKGRQATIVISNADASKIKSASEHLSFLKRCRVVIVVD